MNVNMETFRYKYYDKSKGREVWIYKGENCKACPIRKECVKNKKGVKVVKCFLPEKIRIETVSYTHLTLPTN